MKYSIKKNHSENCYVVKDQLIGVLKASGRKFPITFSSCVHESNDTAYLQGLADAGIESANEVLEELKTCDWIEIGERE